MSEPPITGRWDSFRWFERRRLAYTTIIAACLLLEWAMVIGGAIVFLPPVSSALLIDEQEFRDYPPYLLAFLLLSNVALLVGPVLEWMARPIDPEHFRRRIYRVLLWGQVGLILVVGLLQVMMFATTPTIFDGGGE